MDFPETEIWLAQNLARRLRHTADAIEYQIAHAGERVCPPSYFFAHLLTLLKGGIYKDANAIYKRLDKIEDAAEKAGKKGPTLP